METNVWPWWIKCETEAHHWAATLVNRDVQGGQCDGLFWRHARDDWLMFSGEPNAQQALDEYELPWINAYGQKAMDDALRDTEYAFQASVQRGDTLNSLTEEAERKRLAIAGSKEEARRGRGKGNGRDSEPKRRCIEGVKRKRGSQWNST